MNSYAISQQIKRITGVAPDTEHYRHVEQWESWWRGCYMPFHTFGEADGSGGVIQRRLYTMRMAKKVCEDWAAILLNERTRLCVHDEKGDAFVQGGGDGGVLGRSDFWTQANALIEKAFCTGTGAIVVRLSGMAADELGNVRPDGAAEVSLEFLTAKSIFPISFKEGRLTEAGFASEVTVKGERFVYLELHLLGADGYVIQNAFFTDKNGALFPCSLPEGIAARVSTGSRTPLFAIVRPNIVNNVDSAGAMGVSVFANAIDNLMGVDLAYNNFCRDFKLGGKKVFINKELTKMITDASGRQRFLPPDDVAQQLFLQTGDDMPGDAPLIHEHNPELRVPENVQGIQAQLDYLAFKCGFGCRHYRFDGGRAVTATEYSGERQELIQNAAKHSLIVRRAITDTVRAILWAGRNVLGLDVNENAEITVTPDDSFVTDKLAERERDLKEVELGVLTRDEYREKWVI